MGWTFPAALWLLGLIVLLWLRRRRPPRTRRVVGNLHLWQAADRRSSAALATRLRRHSRLLIQSAIVFAIVMALAGPVMSIGGRRAAIVIDTSLSMSARSASGTRLSEAKTRARQIIDDLPIGTRVRIWTASSDARDLGEFGRRDPALWAALDLIAATDARGDLDTAIRRAQAAEPAPTRVYAIGDQRSGDTLPVDWIRVGTPADNYAVTHAAARPAPDGNGVDVLIVAHNFGAQPVRTELVLRHDAAVVARRPIELGIAAHVDVVVRLPRLSGVVTATLDGTDAIPSDNARSALLPPTDPLRVRFIGSDFHIERALAANPAVKVVTVRDGGAPPADAAAPGPDDARHTILVCAGCPAPPADHPFVLWLPAATTRRAPARVTAAARHHPLLDGVPLDGVFAAAASQTPVSGEAEVVAMADGVPILVAYEGDGRRVVALDAEMADASLAMQPAFPLLLANAVRWLAQPAEGVTLTAGEPFRTRFAGTADASIASADGRTIASAGPGQELVATLTTSAGIYQLNTGAERRPIVINPAVEDESDLLADARDAEAERESLAAPPAAAVVAPGDLSVLALLVAIGLLLVDWRWHAVAREPR